MEFLDILKSNGTCYANHNKEADDEYIPCGNAGLLGTHFACCNRGDKCLSNNACYHDESRCLIHFIPYISLVKLGNQAIVQSYISNNFFTGGITYIAGCTDPAYAHPACPPKGEHRGQDWVGLIWCDRSTSKNSDEKEWVGYNEPLGKPLDDEPTNCECDESKQRLFKGSTVLADVALLPEDPRTGTIYYFPGHVPPTQTVMPAVPTSSSEPTSTGDSDAHPTASAAPHTGADGKFSTGKVVYISLGARLGFLLLIFIIFLVIRWQKGKERRRRSRERGRVWQQVRARNQQSSSNNNNTGDPSDAPSEPHNNPELPGDEPQGILLSPMTPSSADSSRPASRQNHRRSYRAYFRDSYSNYRNTQDGQGRNPQRSSAVSSVSTAPSGWSPSMPVSPLEQQEQGSYRQPELPPISELQG